MSEKRNIQKQNSKPLSKPTGKDNSPIPKQQSNIQIPKINISNQPSTRNLPNTKPTQPSTASSAKSVLSNEDFQLIISNSNNDQKLNTIFNRLFQKENSKFSLLLKEIDRLTEVKSIFNNFLKKQLNSTIKSDSFVNCFVLFLSNSN
jgi:hypothetical protein